jgi:hypothetical protein
MKKLLIAAAALSMLATAPIANAKPTKMQMMMQSINHEIAMSKQETLRLIRMKRQLQIMMDNESSSHSG